MKENDRNVVYLQSSFVSAFTDVGDRIDKLKSSTYIWRRGKNVHISSEWCSKVTNLIIYLYTQVEVFAPLPPQVNMQTPRNQVR